MKTSCLINSYNYARFVCEAIEGALGQTSPFDEIIVVDDGSTDGSLDLLKRTYGQHPIVRIVGKNNEGQLSCLNEGFARSSGDIVFFLDADDVYEPQYVENALAVYQNDESCDFLFSGRRLFGQQEGLSLPYAEDRDLGYSVIRTAYTHAWIGAPTSCLSLRRCLLKKILPLPFVNDWRVRADDCLVFGASLAGAKKRYLAQPLVRYRVHGQNRLHGSRPDPGETFRRKLAINRLFEYFEREFCCNIVRLGEFPHREFRTIDRPTIGQLANYLRVSLGARIPLSRRLACIGDMVLYYTLSQLRSVATFTGAQPGSTDDPEILPFPVAGDHESGETGEMRPYESRRRVA